MRELSPLAPETHSMYVYTITLFHSGTVDYSIPIPAMGYGYGNGLCVALSHVHICIYIHVHIHIHIHIHKPHFQSLGS